MAWYDPTSWGQERRDFEKHLDNRYSDTAIAGNQAVNSQIARGDLAMGNPGRFGTSGLGSRNTYDQPYSVARVNQWNVASSPGGSLTVAPRLRGGLSSPTQYRTNVNPAMANRAGALTGIANALGSRDQRRSQYDPVKYAANEAAVAAIRSMEGGASALAAAGGNVGKLPAQYRFAGQKVFDDQYGAFRAGKDAEWDAAQRATPESRFLDAPEGMGFSKAGGIQAAEGLRRGQEAEVAADEGLYEAALAEGDTFAAEWGADRGRRVANAAARGAAQTGGLRPLLRPEKYYGRPQEVTQYGPTQERARRMASERDVSARRRARSDRQLIADRLQDRKDRGLTGYPPMSAGETLSKAWDKVSRIPGDAKLIWNWFGQDQ